MSRTQGIGGHLVRAARAWMDRGPHGRWAAIGQALGLALLGGGFVGSASASTVVGGAITVDTLWDMANEPYIVTETIQVTDGATLTIEPGVNVRFAADTGLEIGMAGSGGGQLTARGTAQSPIHDLCAGGAEHPGAWSGMTFGNESVDAEVDAGGLNMSFLAEQVAIVGTEIFVNTAELVGGGIAWSGGSGTLASAGEADRNRLSANRAGDGANLAYIAVNELAAFGPCPADVSGHGTVGFEDVLTVTGTWGVCRD